MKNLIGLFFVILIFASCQKAPEHAAFIWKPYSKQALEDSIAYKKPVMIDFWAEWCPNCHELDRTVFSDSVVIAQLSQVTALRMDATNMDDPKVQEIIQAYGIDGVPTIVFLDSQGHEVQGSRIIGLVNPQEFVQALAMALK